MGVGVEEGRLGGREGGREGDLYLRLGKGVDTQVVVYIHHLVRTAFAPVGRHFPQDEMGLVDVLLEGD